MTCVLLAIDIGNSSINMGFFSGAVLVGNFKVPTNQRNTGSSLSSKIIDFMTGSRMEVQLGGVIISSVVPALAEVLGSELTGLCERGAVFLTAALNTGLAFDVASPSAIGTDRIASVVAAKDTYGQPVLVVDFGTATTLSAVWDDTFRGGAILPGLTLMGEALHRGTSKLPYADIASLSEGSPAALGKDTMPCIVSGIIYGSAGAVERLIAEMEREAGIVFNVVLTGGNAGIMSRFLKKDFYLDPVLTLKGLRIIYERNS